MRTLGILLRSRLRTFGISLFSFFDIYANTNIIVAAAEALHHQTSVVKRKAAADPARPMAVEVTTEVARQFRTGQEPPRDRVSRPSSSVPVLRPLYSGPVSGTPAPICTPITTHTASTTTPPTRTRRSRSFVDATLTPHAAATRTPTALT